MVFAKLEQRNPALSFPSRRESHPGSQQLQVAQRLAEKLTVAPVCDGPGLLFVVWLQSLSGVKFGAATWLEWRAVLPGMRVPRITPSQRDYGRYPDA